MFYLLTYNEKGQRGFYWEGEFDLLNYFPRGDWGNARQISFMNQISNWPLRLLIITAEGFFKSVVRKHPEANCLGLGVGMEHELQIDRFLWE